MPATVSGLIIPPHEWPYRGIAIIEDGGVMQFPKQAETTLFSGGKATFEFFDVSDFEGDVVIAYQAPANHGYSPTNWIPNLPVTVLQSFLRDGDVSSDMVFKLDEVVWGDAFVLGREVVDGKTVYVDLDVDEEADILEVLHSVEYLDF